MGVMTFVPWWNLPGHGSEFTLEFCMEDGEGLGMKLVTSTCKLVHVTAPTMAHPRIFTCFSEGHALLLTLALLQTSSFSGVILEHKTRIILVEKPLCKWVKLWLKGWGCSNIVCRARRDRHWNSTCNNSKTCTFCLFRSVIMQGSEETKEEQDKKITKIVFVVISVSAIYVSCFEGRKWKRGAGQETKL